MRVSFYLPITPFSVNNMYYRDRRNKTQDYRNWEMSAFQAISSPNVQEKLAQIRSNYSPEKHAFSVRFNYLFPKEKLFTKSGLISSRAEDLTNIEKALLDVLFLPKFHVQAYPYGAPNINADDKNVLSLNSKKSVSSDGKYYIRVSVALISLPLS